MTTSTKTDALAVAREILSSIHIGSLPVVDRVNLAKAYIRLGIAERLAEHMTEAAVQQCIQQILGDSNG